VEPRSIWTRLDRWTTIHSRKNNIDSQQITISYIYMFRKDPKTYKTDLTFHRGCKTQTAKTVFYRKYNNYISSVDALVEYIFKTLANAKQELNKKEGSQLNKHQILHPTPRNLAFHIFPHTVYLFSMYLLA
jgi:hypothetical protein